MTLFSSFLPPLSNRSSLERRGGRAGLTATGLGLGVELTSTSVGAGTIAEDAAAAAAAGAEDAGKLAAAVAATESGG